ncbi:MAG TPA: TonB-dependent receptor [Solimonas sp.]|nr:TonB-dependent receptor [Solimonas sp.]
MLHHKSTMQLAALLAAIPMSALTLQAFGQEPSLDEILDAAEPSAGDTAAPSDQGSQSSAPASAATTSEAPAAAAESPDAEASGEEAPAVAAEAAAPEILDTIPVATKREPLPPPKREGPAQIEEIVVTATKREQSIRDIPASISAFSGEKLEDSGSLNLNDFIRESPGVTVAQGAPGFSRMTFRGISTDTLPSAGNAQPVGIFIGDVPFTDPYIANIVPDLSAFDLAGVQVLKGPQGTLFGGAALSGAIRYELVEPDLDNWQLRAFSQYTQPKYGSTALTHGVALNAPITDMDVALRLNYVRREYPGIVDDTRSGKKDVAQSSGDQVRAQLLWKPGDWKFKLTHITQDFSGENQLNEQQTPDGPRETDQAVLEAPSRNEFGLNSLEASYDFESLRLVSLTSQVHRDAFFTRDITYSLAGTPPPGYPATAGVLTSVIDNSENISQELRLQSTGDEAFDWLVGAYFFDYEMFFNILIDTPLNQSLLGPGSLLGANPLLATVLGVVGLPNAAAATSLLDGTSNAKSQERAVFADLSYDIGNWTLSAGGRYYQTEVTGGFVGTGLLIAGNQNDGLTSNSVATLEEQGFNPKLAATWQFSDDMSMYLSAAKGFRFGGLQSIPSTATNGVPPTYKSDTLWNYELGLRSNWLDNTLQADLVAFYIDYKNPIITQATQGIPIGYNTNVSAAISQGLEGNLLWNTPIPGLTWSLSGALTDAHITEKFTASNGDVVEPGQEMPGAAKYQYNTALQALLPWGRFGFAPSVSYNYIGKGYSNITHDVEINGYGTLSAGLVVAADGIPGNPKLAINLSNILDEAAPVAGARADTIVTQQPYAQYLLSPPRTLSARISLEF